MLDILLRFLCERGVGTRVRLLGTTLFTVSLLLASACSNGHVMSPPNGALSGNWQLFLQQEEPSPPVVLSVSGFFLQTANSLSANVSVPPNPNSPNGTCGGVGSLTGTVSGQNVTLAINEGGSTLNLTGSIASNNQSMEGIFSAFGGGCFTRPSSGTWTAVSIPPLNGSFTGTLSNSSYMTLLNGVIPPVPIKVTGTMVQSANNGGANATLTGTINATGYPCFTTVSVSGTISGENVILNVFGYDGSQIGSLGTPGSPAIASLGSPGALLSTVGTSGTLVLGKQSATTTVGPCPPLNVGGTTEIGDTTDVAFTFQ